MKAVAAALFVSSAAATTLNLKWSDCSGGRYGVITSLSPTTLTLGQNTKISGSGNAYITVNGGEFNANIKMGALTLASCSAPLGPSKTCNLPLGFGSVTLNPVALPVTPGPVSVSLNLKLASNAPSFVTGAKTHITATSDANQQVICLDVHLEAEDAVVAPVVSVEAPETTLNLKWSDCSGGRYGVITSLSPTTLTLGQNTKISGSGNAYITVNGGNFNANIKMGALTLASCSAPLGPSKTCNLPLGFGSVTLNPVALPVTPGPVSVSLNLKLASNAPSFVTGAKTHITATSDANQEVICLDVHLEQDGAVVV